MVSTVQSFALQQLSVFALQAMVHSWTATGHLCVCTLAFGSCKVLFELPKSALRNGSNLAISHGAHSVPLIATYFWEWEGTHTKVLIHHFSHRIDGQLLTFIKPSFAWKGKQTHFNCDFFPSIFLYLTSECLTATCADPN